MEVEEGVRRKLMGWSFTGLVEAILCVFEYYLCGVICSIFYVFLF
jgi:hypothetical protein